MLLTTSKFIKFSSLWNRTNTQHGVRSLRNGRQSNAPLKSVPFEEYGGSGNVSNVKIMKALIFTGALTVGSFVGASIAEYENTRSYVAQKVRKRAFPTWFVQKKKPENPWEQMMEDFKSYWKRLTPGEKVFVPICALNLLVFGLWRVPRLQQTMMTYFSSNPASRALCWPMFLSTFSHYSFMHLLANMYVLHSCVNTASVAMGPEQFVGLYLSAGIIASMASILYKVSTAQSGMSIGASGAIMGALAYVCSVYPETQMNLIFLPSITFSAGSALNFIMLMDLAGCLMGWKYFDHAAHLGGALFGIFWAHYGPDLWQKRIPLLNVYHNLRNNKK